MMMENSAIGASQYNTDQTGIMRYSQINTTVIQKQKQKPFEEIMIRRKVREIIANNTNELQFSAFKQIEFDGVDQVQIGFAQDDHLHKIQSEIIEELVLKRDAVHVVPQLNKNNYLKKKPSFRNTLQIKAKNDNRSENVSVFHDEQQIRDMFDKEHNPMKIGLPPKKPSIGKEDTDQSLTVYDARFSSS